ncbi:MAG: class I SAM-dependent methyltransferase [Clostridia bacterium]|jgi:hypothetical protein|nr:class I SAM-dependent methyltransferase [Clostridia bacterium]
MLKVAVTTSIEEAGLSESARQAAAELGIAVLPRRKKSLEQLRVESGLDYLLVIEKDRAVLKGETTLAWHPGMAVPKIKALRAGKPDPLLEALGLTPGASVLDCTLGLAADALLIAFAIGPAGRVTGLEASPYIAFITKQGLQNYDGPHVRLQGVPERIHVLNRNYREYLEEAGENSFDAVYFDPMFGYPLKKSSSLNALRPLASYDEVTPSVIRQALRAAKKSVVMKQNARSEKADELQPDEICGGRYSPVTYYVWKK